MIYDLSLVCSYCCCVHAFVAGVESCKTRTTKATKAGHKAAVSSYQKVVLSSPDPARMMMLLFRQGIHLCAFARVLPVRQHGRPRVLRRVQRGRVPRR